MATSNHPDIQRHDANQLIVFQIVVLCFSIVFLYVLYNGWSSLFSHSGAIVATLGSAFLALLAWSLGRYIGNSEGGIGTKGPLFALMLILSAAGVFNWMMIHLEGKTIFLEAVTGAEDAFAGLKTSAIQNVTDNALSANETDFKNKEGMFLREVRNPLNCGYGPIARQRLDELKAVLPNLQLPSQGARVRGLSAVDCSDRANVFRDAIDREWESTDAGKKLGDVRTTQATITGTIDQKLQELHAMRERAGTDGVDYILGTGRDDLQNLNEAYKDLLSKVATYAPNNGLPRGLELTTVSRLGEWSQIISVITSRFDQVSTYVYIALAVFMDFMLIYIFREYRTVKMRQPKKASPINPDVPHLT